MLSCHQPVSGRPDNLICFDNFSIRTHSCLTEYGTFSRMSLRTKRSNLLIFCSWMRLLWQKTPRNVSQICDQSSSFVLRFSRSCGKNQPQKKRSHAIIQLPDGMTIQFVLIILQQELNSPSWYDSFLVQRQPIIHHRFRILNCSDQYYPFLPREIQPRMSIGHSTVNRFLLIAANFP